MSASPKPFRSVALALLHAGYSPLPQRPSSQVPFLHGWPSLAGTPLADTDVKRFGASPLAYNVGIALGFNNVIAIDRDTDDAAIMDALRPVFARIYERGGVPVAKFGSKGLTSFFRWSGSEPFKSRTFANRELGTIIEAMGAGRSTTLPPSLHPKSGGHYRWTTARTLLDTKPRALPTMTAGDLLAIETALEPFMPATPVAASRAIVATADLSEHDRERHARYALAILDREAANLADMAPNSGRNRAAFALACRVGRFVHHGIIQQSQVVSPIVAACEANGLVHEGRAAIVKTIASGLARAAHDELPDLNAMQGGRL